MLVESYPFHRFNANLHFPNIACMKVMKVSPKKKSQNMSVFILKCFKAQYQFSIKLIRCQIFIYFNVEPVGSSVLHIYTNVQQKRAES